MTLKIAREIAAQLREQENEDDDISIAAVVLDDRVAELEAKYETTGQKCNSGHVNNLPIKLWDCPVCTEKLRMQRDALLDVCRTILNGLENVHVGMLRSEIAKYDKDLPRIKDMIGLYADKTEGVALEKNNTGGKT